MVPPRRSTLPHQRAPGSDFPGVVHMLPAGGEEAMWAACFTHEVPRETREVAR